MLVELDHIDRVGTDRPVPAAEAAPAGDAYLPEPCAFGQRVARPAAAVARLAVAVAVTERGAELLPHTLDQRAEGRGSLC